MVTENNEVLGDPIITPDKKQTNEKAYRKIDVGTVNSNGPFFNKLSKTKIGYNRTTEFQGYEPGSRESRVTQILHELAHMLYRSDGKGGFELLIPDDNGSGLEGQSSVNTATVLANCKAQIDSLNGEKK